MAAEREMLKVNLKRILNHPGAQILRIFSNDIAKGCSPQTEGDAGSSCGRAWEALACCQHNDVGNKAPGWNPSPSSPGLGGAPLNSSPCLCVLVKGLLTPPASCPTQMTASVLPSKLITGMQTQGNAAVHASSGFGSSPERQPSSRRDVRSSPATSPAGSGSPRKGHHLQPLPLQPPPK